MFWENNLMVRALQTLVFCSGYFRQQTLFAEDRATPLFWNLYDNRDELSHNERVFVEVLRDFWNGGAHTDFSELHHIDYETRALIFGLYQALSTSSGAVLDWINRVDD